MTYDLVFEGGGAKGMVFAGACEEFFGNGHSFGRLLGTSAGAITATLLAAGYMPGEMLNALVEKGGDGRSVFAGFLGPPAPFSDEELQTSATRRFLDQIDFTFLPDFLEKTIREILLKRLSSSQQFCHILSLVERGGWFAADRFISWLSSKLSTGSYRGGKRDFAAMTLQQFFDATQAELSVVASDTTDGRILVLNHRTAPDCPAAWAVRMSMSIPLIWDEVLWQAGWGQYQGRDITGHAIVDGGLLSNFPIELFISASPQVTRLMGPNSGNPVMGLLIDEDMPVSSAKGLFLHINIKPGELRTLQRLRRLVDTATGAHDKMVIDEYSHLVVHLPALGYGTTEFDMSDDRREALVAAGRFAMVRYLAEPVRRAVPPGSFAKGPVLGAFSTADRIASAILERGSGNRSAAALGA